MRRLLKFELIEAAEILVEAFKNDPLWRYMLSTHLKKREICLEFYKILVEIEWTRGRLMGIGSPLCGVVMWHPRLTRKKSLRQQIQALFGLRKLVSSTYLKMGLRAAKVMFKFWQMERKHAKAPYYHLLVIAIAPTMQGKGIASKLIRPVLRLADKYQVGAYVETVSPRNVAIYKHFGFEVKEMFTIRNANLNGWGMYRPPQTI